MVLSPVVERDAPDARLTDYSGYQPNDLLDYMPPALFRCGVFSQGPSNLTEPLRHGAPPRTELDAQAPPPSARRAHSRESSANPISAPSRRWSSSSRTMTWESLPVNANGAA